ncbi:CTP synthase ura7 [Cryptotrichosporon argae]
MAASTRPRGSLVPDRPSAHAYARPPASASVSPLPAGSRALRGNRSFVALARMIGLGARTDEEKGGADAADADEDEDEGEEEGDGVGSEADDADEDALLWDAQTALDAGHAALAVDCFTKAARAPVCSAAACLALGHLLAREACAAPPSSSAPGTLSPFVRAVPRAPRPERKLSTSPPPAWTLPTHGRRVVRDVERLGTAAGWLVLGLAWVVDAELAREGRAAARRPRTHARARTPPRTPPNDGAADTTPPSLRSMSTAESLLPSTPAEESDEERTDQSAVRLYLLYDLLSSLVQLYRHGHVQAGDAVFLPPLAASDLPRALRQEGNAQKGRNAWTLGAVVAAAVVQLQILNDGNMALRVDHDGATREGTVIIAKYILGMTAPPHLSASYWRGVLEHRFCGLELPDQLVRHATQRLNTSLRATPTSAPTTAAATEYPFPLTTSAPPAPSVTSSRNETSRSRSGTSSTAPASSSGTPVRRAPAGTRARPPHRRQPSSSSTASVFSARAGPGSKSTASLASLTLPSDEPERPVHTRASAAAGGDAAATLRRLRAFDTAPDADAAQSSKRAWWPDLAAWTGTAPRRARAGLPAFPLPTETGSDELSLPPAAGHAETIAAVQANHKSDSVTHRPLRPVASSPHLTSPSPLTSLDPHTGATRVAALSPPPPPAMLRPKSSAALRRTVPVPEPPADPHAIAPIDPALAAAELASALTRHGACGVCGAQGVNLPSCPKCGLAFCSRACRVGETRAGNGKRHICGAWESRRLMQTPHMQPQPQPVADGTPVGSPRAAKVH